MNTAIQLFNNPEFGELRTSKLNDGIALFCLNDVCKALDISNPRNTIQRLNQKGVHSIDTPTQGGVQSLNFIDEPNLYRCIFQSRKAEAEKFQDWVFEEVLPSIRNSGGYMVSKSDDTPESLMARALLLAKDTMDRQTKQLAEQAPKVLFAKAVETSKKSCLVGELSTILKQNGIDIGQNRLFRHMRDEGYLCKAGERYNLPTQRSMEMELFEVKKTSISKPDGTILVTTTTKVTGKGQVYFVNKFLQNKSGKDN